MYRNERTVASACGIIKLEGMIVPKTVRDSIARCLDDEAIFDFAVVYVAGARANYRSMHKVERSETDPYCYEGTETPVNRLNIRDNEVLRTKMRDVVPIRIAELEKHPIVKPLSEDYLWEIHRRLYGDIFDWAGEYRTTDIDPLRCRSEFIDTNVRMLFDELCKKEYLSDVEDISADLAHVVCELHAISPFKVGDTPCILTMANILAILNGKYLDYSKASEGLFEIALKRSLVSDTDEMTEIFRNIITDY